MASQPPMTSSPIKPVTDMGHEIWCGGDTSNNNNSKPSKIRNIRQTVEQQLQNLALNGQTSKLIKLLEDGAPFVIDMDGQTVLHLASSAGHLDTVEALLDRGCDANVQDFSGHTALQRASSGGHLGIVRSLLGQGSSLDHQDELHGNTALHEAAWKGFSQTVSTLCGSKANVYMKNRGGFTPLHLSCQNGHNQSCRVLLLHGCRPDVKNNNGDTALHIAAAMGRKKLTKILVEAGTDTNIRNKQNETAYDIAVRKHLSEIVTILECNSIQNIISDLEHDRASAEESQEVRQILKHEPLEVRHVVKQEHGLKPRDGSVRAKRQMTNTNLKSISARHVSYDSTELSSMSSSNTSSHIRAEHKYHKKSKHRGGGTGGGCAKADKNHCDCTPLLEKIGKTIEKDKKEILNHLVQNNKKIEIRLDGFEKKTKNQMFNFNQNMKECFANERNDCQERMERRFLKDNIEMERQRAIRDIMIKRDIARWLQARLSEIEARHGLEADNRAVLKKLTRRKSRREARAVISEMKNGGTLRRAHSVELVSDAESCHMYRGLVIADRPGAGADNSVNNSGNNNVSENNVNSSNKDGGNVRTRVRHNSEGNYDDVSILQETILNDNDNDRVYQNLMFHKDLTQFKNEARVRVPLPSHVHHNNVVDTDSSSCSMASLQLAGHVTSGHTCVTSDTGSLDSHNDSGYSTRLGISDPASPSLSVTDSEPLLDPQAIYMIPSHWDNNNYNNNFNDTVVCNSKSSLV